MEGNPRRLVDGEPRETPTPEHPMYVLLQLVRVDRAKGHGDVGGISENPYLSK